MKKLTIQPDFIKPAPLSITEKKELKELEISYQISFPKALISLFNEYRNARVFECDFTTRCGKYIYGITSFYDLKMFKIRLEAYHTDDGTNMCQGEWWSGENWIPFNSDSGGWTFLISNHPDLYGNIYLDKNEWNDEEDRPEYTFLTNSLEEFINGLHLNKCDKHLMSKYEKYK